MSCVSPDLSTHTTEHKNPAVGLVDWSYLKTTAGSKALATARWKSETSSDVSSSVSITANQTWLVTRKCGCCKWLVASPNILYAHMAYFKSDWLWQVAYGWWHSIACCSCEREVAGGQLWVTGCKWLVVSDRLQVAGCEWQVTSGWLWVTGYKWLVVSDRLQVAGCEWQVTSGWLWVTGYKWLVVSDRLHVAGCEWQVAGGWLWVTGCRWMVVSDRQEVAGCECEWLFLSDRLQVSACGSQAASKDT